MCFQCPPVLVFQSGNYDVRFSRIAEDAVQASDVTDDPARMASFGVGERVLVALEGTAVVGNLPVATYVLHGIVESDVPGEEACAFDDVVAMVSVWDGVLGVAALKSHLPLSARVLH